MPMVEAAAASLVFAKLDADQDYGSAGPAQVASARAQLQVIANAFAKCIPHLVSSGIVTTTDTVAVSGAAPSPPTAGAVVGTGLGQVGGLIQGDAEASVGLAGAVMGVLVAGQVFLPGADVPRARISLALLADACAEFAPYVMANAVVNTTVTGVATTLGANGPSSGTGTGAVA